MNKNLALALVILYLFAILASLCYCCYLQLNISSPNKYSLLYECILIGGLGGILYCLRGTYLNYCVKKNWSNEWLLWYIVRPIVSLMCGGISYLFLKAGLLILEAKKETDSTNLGFYALAFVAGMNVDKFLSKIEDLAHATWGIEKSRTSANQNDNKKNE